MRTLPLTLLLAIFFCHPVLAEELASQPGNPLIRDELKPIKNADFEQGLSPWVRTAEPRHEVPDRHVIYEASPIAYEGEGSLMIESTSLGDHYLPSPTFTVPRDRRYYLSARIRTEGSIHGAVRPVAGAGSEQYSHWVGPDQDWTRVGLAFQSTGKANVGLPPGEKEYDGTKSYIELRLETRGKGKVYFDDIRVYETYSYAPCFRVKLLSPAKQPYRVKLHAMVGQPNWFFTRTYFEEGVEPGAYSPWIDLRRTKEFLGDRVNSAGLHIEPLAGPQLDQVKLEIEFTSAPPPKMAESKEKPADAAEELLDLDSDPLEIKQPTKKPAKDSTLYGKLEEDSRPDPAVLRQTKVFETPGNVIGLFIPSATVSPEEFARGLRPLADDVRMRHEHVRSLGLPPVDLEHYYIEAHHKGFESFFTDPALLDMEIDTLRQIGFSALDSQYAGLAGKYLELADKHQLGQTHQTTVGHTLMEDPGTMRATFDERALKERISAKVDAWFASMKQNDAEQLRRIRFFVLCDEIWGVAFSGQAFEQGFRDYLKQHGITPEELGHKDYAEIEFHSTWGWRDSWTQRPWVKAAKLSPEPEKQRMFYWQQRFWSHATARAYAMLSEAIHKHLPGVPTVVNHGMPWAYGYDGYMRGAEVFEFARQNALTAFIHEDWLNTSGWRHSGIQLNGFLADFSRSIGQVNDSPAYAYIMPCGEGEIQLKLASVVGKGVKVIDLYRYGPAYASPDNWSQNLPQVAGVAKYLRQLDAAEDVLAEARPRPAQTAILWSASNDIWRETDANVYDQQLIYLALQHRQIPVDFVDEFAIEEGRLKDYQVAYLNAEHIRKDALAAILKWVSDGGHLWVDALAGSRDEYMLFNKDLHQAMGLSKVMFTQSDVEQFETQHGLPQQKPLDHLTFKGSDQPLEAIGYRVSFQIEQPDETEILATYSNGDPAVIERQVGQGSIYFVGTLAGCSYGRPVIRERGQVERGYRDAERRMITDFAFRHGIVPPVGCNVPGVQADLLEGPRGLGIVLANFADGSQERIELTVQLKQPIKSAKSVARGELKWRPGQKANTAVLELPLDLTDFVLLE